MVSPALAHLLLSLIVGIGIVLMLIRPRNIPEVYWIAGGVLLLLVLRLVRLQLAVRAAAKALDVCLFLIGMMLLSELAREHGVFDWLSSVALRSARGSCSRLFALVYAVGTIVTMFMSNDATAVVLTPAILTAVRKAKVQPLPYLFVCAFIANAASFLLPISNPSESGGVSQPNAAARAMALVLWRSVSFFDRLDIHRDALAFSKGALRSHRRRGGSEAAQK
jgi:arsenical pump membrane protein